VALAAAGLKEEGLVALCRRVRAAGDELGLDDRATLALSSATCELARVLRERGASGQLELVCDGPSLQILGTARGAESVGAALRDLVSRLRPLGCGLTIAAGDDGWSLRLAAPGSAAASAVPGATPGRAFVGVPDLDVAVPELDQDRGVDQRRALKDTYAALEDINCAFVALHIELEERGARLREAEDRLRLLLDSVKGYAICLLSADGRIASWSSGAERLFSLAADRILGENVACLYTMEERKAGIPERRLQEALADERSESESTMVRGDGEAFDAHVVIAPVRNGSGDLRGFSVVVQDVTERRRLEDDLRRRADDLAAANRAKEDFLATLSHELRTPLNAILGWTRLLRWGKLQPSGVERALETIERNARLQAQLIADILDVSRIVTGKLRLQLVPLELAPVVSAVADSLRPGADAKGVTIELALGAAGVVLGDPDRLQQVVWNLLSNAIKFTPSGGVVRVALERTATSMCLVVSDNGEGIDAALLPFVFDRFRQGDASVTRPHGGLGLGLSIVRHIVELHGGKVEVTSEGRGQGSTFSVQLPNRADAQGAPESADVQG
jgi:PAS domain S-box-containing protein